MKKLIAFTKNSKTRDPFITKYNGLYYHCYTEDSASVSVSCADTIDGLSNAEGVKVFVPEPNREFSTLNWAPELHFIDSRCYIYVACADSEGKNHKMYVLENGSDDPMQLFSMHGEISDHSGQWAIDATILTHKDNRYFVWSGGERMDGAVCQNLYIAKMKNPYELESERVLISTPEYEWEKRGCLGGNGKPYVNEGPCSLDVDGQTYLLYSAAGSWCEHYCIAVLKLVGDDPMKPEAWIKYEYPILAENELVRGPGHCSVVCDDDGMHLFFHAWDKTEEDINWYTVSVWQAEMDVSGDVFTIQ